MFVDFILQIRTGSSDAPCSFDSSGFAMRSRDDFHLNFPRPGKKGRLFSASLISVGRFTRAAEIKTLGSDG